MKRLESMHNAKDLQEKLKLARNEEPGTPFDPLFAQAASFLHLMDITGGWGKGKVKPTPIMELEGAPILASIGIDFVNLFQARDGVQKLHEMADALGSWKRHKRDRRLKQVDYIREVLLLLDASFTGKHRLELVKGKIVKGEPFAQISEHDVARNLQWELDETENPRKDIANMRAQFLDDDGQPRVTSNTRRAIRREAKQLHIPLRILKAGRPNRK